MNLIEVCKASEEYIEAVNKYDQLVADAGGGGIAVFLTASEIEAAAKAKTEKEINLKVAIRLAKS